jgi:hypothetical protein
MAGVVWVSASAVASIFLASIRPIAETFFYFGSVAVIAVTVSVISSIHSVTAVVAIRAVAIFPPVISAVVSAIIPSYTNLEIETMATVQAVYHKPGCQTQGFLESIFELMKIKLPVPDHSTLSRRRRSLNITLLIRDRDKSRHLIVDSTGVKVYGEGEWKVRQRDWSYRRIWLKLHLCVDDDLGNSQRRSQHEQCQRCRSVARFARRRAWQDRTGQR